MITCNEKYTIEPQVQITAELKAPIEKGTKIGTVKYEVEGITYETNLLAGNTVEKTYMPQFFILLFVTLILIFGTAKIKDNYKKKRRIRKIRSM